MNPLLIQLIVMLSRTFFFSVKNIELYRFKVRELNMNVKKVILVSIIMSIIIILNFNIYIKITKKNITFCVNEQKYKKTQK